MNKNKDIGPFENLLKGYYLSSERQTANGINDLETSFVFSRPLKDGLSPEMESMLLRSLEDSLGKESLGSVITSSLNEQKLDKKVIQEKTGLTPSLVEAITNDLVFTNSVPVKSLARLIKLLGLSMERALDAIQVTFDKLQTESKVFVSVPDTFQPSYRKGVVRGEIGKELSNLKSDESYLYQNELALDKYTSRLKELYQTV